MTAYTELLNSEPRNWWDDDNFPMSAPWWFRYPLGVAVLCGALYVAFYTDGEWFALLSGALLAFVGISLIRELFLGVLAVAAIWWITSMMSAAPIPTAIIIGALIIAYGGKR